MPQVVGSEPYRRYRQSMEWGYALHRHNSKTRNIPFRLTFDEWRTIWHESGKWNQHGNQRGRYCMARYGDQGAYEVGNVRICLIEENRAERNRNYSLKGEQNPAYAKDYFAALPPKKMAAHRASVSRRFKGIPKSAAQNAANAAVASTRKLVVQDGRRVWAHPGDVDYPKPPVT